MASVQYNVKKCIYTEKKMIINIKKNVKYNMEI